MPLPKPSRRAVLASVVWSTPVIVAASAAPAFAVSEGLSVAAGATRLMDAGTGLGWSGPLFEGFTVQSPTALGPDELSVTLIVSSPSDGVFFRYDPDSGDHQAPPAPWTAPEPGFYSRSITFTYSSSVAANESVHLDGFWALAADARSVPLFGATLTVAVSTPDATRVVGPFTNGLTVDGGLTRIAEVPQSPGYVGPVFDGFTIQSDTPLGAGDLVVSLDLNEGSVIYEPGARHDAVAEPWAAVVESGGASGRTVVFFTYANALEANVPVALDGYLGLAASLDLSPATTVNPFRVRVAAPGMPTVSRLFFHPA